MTAFLILTASVLSLVVGIYFGYRTRRRPEFYWTYLIIGLVFTVPLAIGGYTWYDEFFAGGYLLANLPGKMRIKNKASHILFIIFLCYMILQAFRGIVFFSEVGFGDAIKKVRWVAFFTLVFFLFLKITSEKVEAYYDRNLPYKVTIAGLVFNVIYLMFGAVSLYVSGSTGFTQNAMISDVYRLDTSPLLAIFGSTAYTASVLFVIVPAALISIKNDTLRSAKFAWLVLALALATQVLFLSRSGMLAITIFLVLFFFQNWRSRRVLHGLVVFSILVFSAVVIQDFFNEIPFAVIFEDLKNTLHLGDASRFNVDLQDIDRKIWNYSAVLALSDNPLNMLFGHGLRTSGYVVAPYVYELFLEARGFASYNDDVATPAFAALAVDTGVVGLLLILALWGTCLTQIYSKVRKLNLFMLFGPTVFILHLFVINIFDVMFLYLALMPSGLYQALAEKRSSIPVEAVQERRESY